MNANDYVFCKRNGETLIKPPGSLDGNGFVLDTLHDCEVYVLDHTSQVQIDDCVNCKIFIAPTDGSVFLRDCRDCTLCVAARQLRTRDCKDLDIALYCATQPSIETSIGIVFSCWRGAYPGLTEHFKQARLDPSKNTWTQVYDFNSKEDLGAPHYRLDESVRPWWIAPLAVGAAGPAPPDCPVPAPDGSLFGGGRMELPPSKPPSGRPAMPDSLPPSPGRAAAHDEEVELDDDEPVTMLPPGVEDGGRSFVAPAQPSPRGERPLDARGLGLLVGAAEDPDAAFTFDSPRTAPTALPPVAVAAASPFGGAGSESPPAVASPSAEPISLASLGSGGNANPFFSSGAESGPEALLAPVVAQVAEEAAAPVAFKVAEAPAVADYSVPTPAVNAGFFAGAPAVSVYSAPTPVVDAASITEAPAAPVYSASTPAVDAGFLAEAPAVPDYSAPTPAVDADFSAEAAAVPAYSASTPAVDAGFFAEAAAVPAYSASTAVDADLFAEAAAVPAYSESTPAVDAGFFAEAPRVPVYPAPTPAVTAAASFAEAPTAADYSSPPPPPYAQYTEEVTSTAASVAVAPVTAAADDNAASSTSQPATVASLDVDARVPWRVANSRVLSQLAGEEGQAKEVLLVEARQKLAVIMQTRAALLKQRFSTNRAQEKQGGGGGAAAAAGAAAAGGATGWALVAALVDLSGGGAGGAKVKAAAAGPSRDVTRLRQLIIMLKGKQQK